MASEGKELQRAAVMFPRFFLWVIGALLSALTLLTGAVVAQVRSVVEDNTKKVERHEMAVNDHEARLRLQEQITRDLKDTAKETNQDVKEIRKLLEQRERRDNGSTRRGTP